MSNERIEPLPHERVRPHDESLLEVSRVHHDSEINVDVNILVLHLVTTLRAEAERARDLPQLRFDIELVQVPITEGGLELVRELHHLTDRFHDRL